MICSAVLVSPSWALGGDAIGNDVPSARAAGQGYVGIAGQNNDPIVVYENPAALTSLKGTQITIGGTWENFHGDYEDNTGSTAKMRSLDVGIPNFAVTQSFMDGKIGAGLSVGDPYGLETHWSGDSPLRYTATNSVMHIVTVSPAVAYQIDPMVSVGLGGDYFNVFDASLEKHIDSTAVNYANGYFASSPDANSRLDGTGTNWGYHAGVVLQPNEQNSFGLTYHSKVKLTITGTASITGMSGVAATLFGGPEAQTSAFTDIFIPQNIQLGYAYKPTDRWTLEADTAWYDWNSSRDINIRYTDPRFTALSAAVNPRPTNWRNEWTAATGANYKATDRLQLRGGFWYIPATSPDSTFSPAFMDLSRYAVCAGAGYKLTDALTIDFAYNAIFFHSRQIDNTLTAGAALPPNNTVSGNYSNFTNLVALNFTYRFGAK